MIANWRICERYRKTTLGCHFRPKGQGQILLLIAGVTGARMSTERARFFLQAHEGSDTDLFLLHKDRNRPGFIALAEV